MGDLLKKGNTMRRQNNYNEVLGITTDNELVVVEYTFKDGEMSGAVGWRMETLDQEQINLNNDPEQVEEEYSFLWEEAVAQGETELGLTEYIQELIDREEYNPDTYFIGDDPSFRYETDKAVEKLPEADKAKLTELLGEKGKDFVDWTCGGCGRCIPLDESEYKVIFNKDLLAECRRYEGE